MALPVIVIGGGLSGLAAAHTVLQSGGNVVMVDKNPILGGNSTKATSGINGAETKTQAAMGIPDKNEIFEEDTIRGATGVKKGPCPPSYPLAKVLTHNSGKAVHWLQEKFDLKLDTVSRLGGHSQPRTHRTKTGGKFPGMEITYRLMVEYDEICKKSPDRAKLITRARVNRLLKDASGKVIGVVYKEKSGAEKEVRGSAVIVASGGFGAGVLENTSALARIRPDLMHLPTTNGSHCTGDAIDFVGEVGGAMIDLEQVQVHPTGLVHPADPNGKVKFLAAEALRGEGGMLLATDGTRFCNELGTRDYVSKCMMDTNKYPYHLILNSACAAGIDWHCRHYTGRGVMKRFENGADMAKDMGISVAKLEDTFNKYNAAHASGNDVHGRKFFNGMPWKVNDSFYKAVVTPIVHYTMGGVEIDEDAQIVDKAKNKIPGLFAAGEVTGGVHGKNRLGGSALLECVVFGRVAGASAWKYVNQGGATAGAHLGSSVTMTIQQPGGALITLTISGGNVSTSGAAPAAAAPSGGAVPSMEDADAQGNPEIPGAGAAPAASGAKKEFTLADVAKHNTEKDCWVAVNGKVLNVTNFLEDHPGGKMAILTFAGKDASEEFNMLHEKDVIEKYAPETIVGDLKGLSSKL